MMLSPEDQVFAIMTDAFNFIGPSIVEVVREEISTQYPPASEPATPPHRRTGNLQNLIRFAVDGFHDGVTFTLISDAEYSRFLRDGTQKMASRDFMGDDAIDRYLPIVVQRLQEYLSGAGNPTSEAA